MTAKLFQSAFLFTWTAVFEILGCYLPYLCFRKGKSLLLLLPASLSLALFVWLLTLHPAAAGRTYAAYGGVYVTIAILWLWLVERVKPTSWDLIGSAITIVGMIIIVLGSGENA